MSSPPFLVAMSYFVLFGISLCLTSGCGVTPGTDITAQTLALASPTSLSWAGVAVGNAGGAKSATLTNSASAAITISNIQLTGANPGDFAIYQKTCGSTLAPKLSCTVTVLFKPTTSGTRTANLTFADSGGASPQQVSLTGLGTITTTTQSASITADFASRSGGVTIPANMLGTEYFENLPTNANRATVAAAGFTNERYRLQVPLIFPNGPSTPVWTTLDSDMEKFVVTGTHPLIELEYTPSFLQPPTLRCPSNPTASVPTSVDEWGSLVATIAGHLDHRFPGLATYYEIWNEPNGAGLCSSNKLRDYIRIYAAAARKIKAQGTADHTVLYTGGPAAANVAFTEILTNASTAPYVDFYSYHFYVASPTAIKEGMTWNGAGGTPSLYSMTLSPYVGVQKRYLLADAAVKKATTPLGANTPIFFDEYNEDWAFLHDCCRNSPVYSPVFNGIVVAEILDSVYKGANQVPHRMIYYAAAQSTFCILGVLDPAMDCARASNGAEAQPYPQWYLYRLLFAPSYLDLQDGGHVASSVMLSSGATSAGLIAAAYYTHAMDAAIVVNPTSASLTGVTLRLQNPGSLATLSAYIIDGSHPHIDSWPASKTSVSRGLQATFDLPAYSVVAISLK